MDTTISAPHAGVAATQSSADATRTRALLSSGVVVGPLFVGVVLLQILTRPGFDLGRHPISLLSLGDLGWIQIANFIVAGLLAMSFAIGARRVLRGSRGGTWGPLLLGLFGAGLVAGGVFVADPALGFPPGTPDGIPDQFSWHGTLHAFAPPGAFTALIAATFVFARRFRALRLAGWTAYSLATGIVAIALVAWPDPNGFSVRLFVGVVIGFVWLAAIALRLRGEPSQEGTSAAR
jgi:branched-subunit amino acid transport protein